MVAGFGQLVFCLESLWLGGLAPQLVQVLLGQDLGIPILDLGLVSIVAQMPHLTYGNTGWGAWNPSWPAAPSCPGPSWSLALNCLPGWIVAWARNFMDNFLWFEQTWNESKMYQYSPGTKGGKEFQQWEMAAASIPLDIICHKGGRSFGIGSHQLWPWKWHPSWGYHTCGNVPTSWHIPTHCWQHWCCWLWQGMLEVMAEQPPLHGLWQARTSLG